jgi:hypothetical protein
MSIVPHCGTFHHAPLKWLLVPKHPITNEVKSHITSIMKPIFEDWLNSEEDQYQPTPKPIIVSEEGATVYGTRRYLRGSAIHLHTDRVSSQVISSNLNVDQVSWIFSKCSQKRIKKVADQSRHFLLKRDSLKPLLPRYWELGFPGN